MPFQNISGDPEQEYFADGMVEEIITVLARIRWLCVIARNSSFTYKGQPIDVKQVGSAGLCDGLVAGKANPEAFRLPEQAIARDPGYGPALAWAAVCCARLLDDGRSEDREAHRPKGANFARRAREVPGADPIILANAALASAYPGEDIGAMMAFVDRAPTLNPNFARGWVTSDNVRFWAGQPDIAIEHIETALHLSPRARIGTSLVIVAAAHFFAQRPRHYPQRSTL
jgi:hypothetical protein